MVGVSTGRHFCAGYESLLSQTRVMGTKDVQGD